VPRERVRVVHPGIDPRFHPNGPGDGAADAARLRAAGVASPYVLQVGAFERHKGGAIAAAAIAELRAEGRPLTLVRCGPPGPEAQRHGCVDLGHVDDDTLVSLYRGAAALCVPSSHEGFGLPVVEAMACGTPVVTVSGTALPEAAGGAALTTEPGDVRALRSGIALLLDDASAAARLRAAGLERARRLDWSAAAAAVREELELAATGAATR
jgi:glycosyltransferase involved in cell wall biosynthesis